MVEFTFRNKTHKTAVLNMAKERERLCIFLHVTFYKRIYFIDLYAQNYGRNFVGILNWDISVKIESYTSCCKNANSWSIFSFFSFYFTIVFVSYDIDSYYFDMKYFFYSKFLSKLSINLILCDIIILLICITRCINWYCTLY